MDRAIRQSMTRSPDYPIPGCLGELAPRLQFTCGAVGERAGVEVDLDVSASQVAADELFGKRVFDVPLDRPAQRARAIRAVLAGHFDDPVDDIGRQRDLELAIDE